MLETALAFGADAVYAGQPRYSLRVRNNGFRDEAALGIGIEYAHSRGKQFYVVSNIFPHNRKLKTYLADMAPVIALKPDALIMADPGLIDMIRETWPEMPVHLSVQANTVNYAAVRFWKKFGIRRVILSRELSLDQVAEIRQECPDMELEVFVHGALCIAYSGRCLLSGYFNHRDPNQGACTNSCRREYDVPPGKAAPDGDVYLLEEKERAGTGGARRGFVEVVKELEQRFPDPAAIEKEADKKAFVKLFGEYLRVENVLQNYDEFASLKALQDLDLDDAAAVEAFKAKHYLSDDDLAALQAITLPAERKIQDYRSTYNDVRDWLRREKASAKKRKSTIDWDDVVFEVDLLKSQEINLDYILELIFEHNKKTKSKSDLVDEVRRVIRSSLGNRAKESLLVDFINQTDLDKIGDKASVIDAFFTFAQAEQQREAQELISAENLNAEAARRYIATSLKREFASDNGTELNAILPKMSPLNPQYLTKKQSVFQKVVAFVEKFKGVGGQV